MAGDRDVWEKGHRSNASKTRRPRVQTAVGLAEVVPNIERTGGGGAGGYSRYLSTDSEMEERVAVVPASQVVSD